MEGGIQAGSPRGNQHRCDSDRTEESCHDAFVNDPPCSQARFLAPRSRKSVILSEAKNLHWFASHRNCRSFASLRMTATFISMRGPQAHEHSE